MGENGTFWLPESASTLAPTIDSLFYFVTWVSAVLFVGVVAGIIFFAYKYRRRHHQEEMKLVEESKLLEASWIIVPTILVLTVFVWAFQAFIKIGVAPPESYQVRVQAQMWNWQFEYPDGTTSSELYVPMNRPVKLLMSSTDVIHSFFVPAFRVKHDVLPNRYTSVWFEATKPGTYQVFCTEYCGTNHSDMLAEVHAVSQGEFNEWLESAGVPEDASPVERGAILYEQQGCQTCHSLDGSQNVGPTFQGLFGSTEQLQDGSTVQVDENYLRQSILEPGAQIVQGFQNIMPASYGSLDEEQVSALIAFIEEQQ